MGLGREVADAYISVHGDLSDFRRDLEKAGPMTEKLAQENAQTFADAWGDRVESSVNGKWGSIVDAMYSDKRLDWDRLVGKFDANGNLDEAQDKIRKFLGDMAEASKLTEEEYVKADDAMKGMLGTLRELRDAEKDRLKMQDQLVRGSQLAMAANTKLFAEAAAENERWSRTFEGMSKITAIKDLESDFRNLTEAMAHDDIHGFAKSFDEDWTRLRTRVMEVTDAMSEQGRISEENRRKIHDAIDEHIEREEALRQATARTTTEVGYAKLAQDRYNKSLEGMIEASQVQRLEKDFRNLADAINSGNWDLIQRGHKDMNSMRFAVGATATEMRRLGRMTDDTFTHVMRTVGALDRNFTTATTGARNLGSSLHRNNTFLTIFRRGLDNVVGKIKGLAGFNVIGDVFRDGSRFIQNLDRNAVKIAQMTTLIGGLASVLGSSLGGLATISNDIVKAAAGLSVLGPAFFTGAGIGIAVMVSAFKDMKTVLADLAPQFNQLQDSISAKFWEQAEEPIRRLNEALFPTLEKQLNNTATSMGALTGAFADGFREAATADRVTVMFERMNAAIDILKGAMAPLNRAFVNLGEVGSKYFGRFAKWLVEISEQFDRFIQKAFDNGDLDKWVERGIQGLKDLGSIIHSTSRAFGALSDAARAAGSKGLAGFAENMRNIADFMSSDRFQKALTGVFRGFYATLNGINIGMAHIGRGLEAFVPTFERISGSLGQVFETLGLYIGKFLENKALQEGIEKFVAGINTALNNLSPAIEPMATSLGGLFSLMADILPNITTLISDIVTKWGPAFDRMLEAIKPLIDPLTNLAQIFIDRMSPVLSKFVDEVLPPLVDLFKALIPHVENLVKFLSPVFMTILDQAGKFFQNMADGLKDFNAEAGPAITRLGEISDAAGKVKLDPEVDLGGTGAGNLAAKFGIALAQMEPLSVVFGKYINEQTKGIQEDIKQFNGFAGAMGDLFNPTKMAGTLTTIAGDIAIWASNVGKDLEEGFGDLVEAAGVIFTNIYEDIKTEFQNFMRSLLGLPAATKNDATVTIGPGGGGVGRGASGKIDPAMLGLGEPEGMFEELLAKIGEELGLFFESIGTNITNFGTTVKTEWDNFWGGLGTKVQEVWDGAVLWIQTKAEEIRVGIETWAADIKLKWDTFWTEVGTTISTKWTEFWTTVSTKAAEIKVNIDTFISDVKTNWNNFWTELGTTIQTKWDEFWSTVSTKTGEIKTNITNFGTDVKNNWNNFWTEVGNKVNSAWEGIKSGVSTGIETVLQWFRELPGKITGAFSNMWAEMSAVGGNIIAGLKAGIDGGIQWVKDAAANVARAAVDAAKAVLEINSPSKAFRRLGLGGGEGMAQGFDWSESPVAKAAAAMAATATDAVTEQFAKSKMFATGVSAALGLAEGLKSSAPGVASAFGSLVPDSATIGINGSSRGVGVPTPAVVNNFAEGAFQSTVVTPTKSPDLVASKVIDEFAAAFSTI